MVIKCFFSDTVSYRNQDLCANFENSHVDYRILIVGQTEGGKFFIYPPASPPPFHYPPTPFVAPTRLHETFGLPGAVPKSFPRVAAGTGPGSPQPPSRRRRPRVAAVALGALPPPSSRRRPRRKGRRRPTAPSCGIGAAPPRPGGRAVQRAEQEQDCSFVCHCMAPCKFSVEDPIFCEL